MKKIFTLILLTGVFFLFAGESKADLNRHGGYFYYTLASYGSWIDMGDGLVVWQPRFMRHNWAPYRYGEWVWTDDGWYWDSYEPYGDIVYHYGRWYNDDYYGWIWVPDDQWAPAWVEWRYDDDYIGWAPLSPYAVFNINVGIHFTHNYYSPYTCWNFVSYHDFCSPNVYNYYIGPKVKYRVYGNTQYRTDYEYRGGNVYNRGIDREFINSRGGDNIRTRQIERVNDPGLIDRNRDRNNNTIRTYIASREDMSRDNLRNVDFKRNDRTTSLDINKVNIGRTRNEDKGRIIVVPENRGNNGQQNNNRIEGNGRINQIPDTRRNDNGQGSVINRGDNRRMDQQQNDGNLEKQRQQQEQDKRNQQMRQQQEQQKRNEQIRQQEQQRQQQVQQQNENRQRQQYELQKQQNERQRQQQIDVQRQQNERQREQQLQTQRQQNERQQTQRQETVQREKQRNDSQGRNRDNSGRDERKNDTGNRRR